MTDAWTSAPLGDVAPAQSNPMPPDDEVVWNLSLDEIESVTGRLLARSTCRVADLGSAKCGFDSRHVLYSKLRPYLNKVVLPDQEGVGTSELIPMLPTSGVLDREFLAFYLRSPYFTEFAKENTRGANLPRIAMASFWKHEIQFPASIEEQRRVVGRIKECMERVEEIDKLQERISIAIDHLPMAARFDLWNTMSVQFDMRPLGEVALSAKNGLYKPRGFHGTGVLLLRMFNINGASFDLSRDQRIEVTAKEAHDYAVRDGDIIVSRVNSRDLVGKSTVVTGLTEPAVHEAMLIRLRVDALRANTDFLVAVMNAPQFLENLRGRAKHAIGQSSINQSDLLTSLIPLPPLARQQQIIGSLGSVWPRTQALRDGADERKAMVGGLRDAILRKAFSGEL